jgi:hypothetical protein
MLASLEKAKLCGLKIDRRRQPERSVRGRKLTAKRHEGTFKGDGLFLHFDCWRYLRIYINIFLKLIKLYT